jgi:hypothetical protein
MTTKKAKLRIILKADATVVEDVENPELWQQVLAAIHQNSPEFSGNQETSGASNPIINRLDTQRNSPLVQFAKTIGVSQQDLIGAVDPSLEAPYLNLDDHCWEAMKKQTPKRGPGAISPTALAGTLLSLWFKEAGLGHPTQGQALEVLDTIGIKDVNASRSVKKVPWLQARSGGVMVLNPAQISKATGIARSFCLKKWKQEDERERTGQEV